MKKVLAIVAHPDDEILGLGSTIKKMTQKGDTASCVILGEGLTSREDNRNDTEDEHLDDLKSQALNAAKFVGYEDVIFCNLPDNRFDSCDLLDVIKKITKIVDEYKPDIIFTHHYGDLNIDHRITFDAVMTACRPIGNDYPSEIYCFHTPSSTEWNYKYGDSAFRPNYFCDVTETIESKLDAMKCYTSEIRDFPHPRSIRALKTIAENWGITIGTTYAEAFELIRRVDRR